MSSSHAMDAHNQAVAAIATQVKRFYDQKQGFRIYHGSTNSTRNLTFRRESIVDTSGLKNLLTIDTEAKTVLVEPNVPMDALVAATLPYGLVPPVVMEFPGITAGGGFAGTAVESSSFRYGYFDRIVNWIEIVLADGTIVTASDSERSDLFDGAATGFGTLGITTLLEVQLIPAKKYVQLTYTPVSSISEAVRTIEEKTEDSTTEYLDGIMFAKNKGAICSGHLTDHPSRGVQLQHFTRAQDPWFYLHCGDIVKNNIEPYTEAIPLVDFLFRYDRGAFWMGAYAFWYFCFPFNRVTRWAFDTFLHTRTMYAALHKSGHSVRNVVQDVGVPYGAAEELMDYLEKDFGRYPLWLCPLKQGSISDTRPRGMTTETVKKESPEFLLNFGVWGPGPTTHDGYIAMNRRLERKVDELGGVKMLYANTFYTEDEFWRIYNQKRHDELRAKYNATYLPSLFAKVKSTFHTQTRTTQASWKAWIPGGFWEIWPISGIYGVISAVLGREYILNRDLEIRVSRTSKQK